MDSKHYLIRKILPCLSLLFFTVISFSQDYDALAEECPCMVEMQQKSNEFLTNPSSDDLQIYSQCIALEMYECYYSCEDDPGRRAEIQTAINQCKANIQYYAEQGIVIDCDNMSASSSPPRFIPGAPSTSPSTSNSPHFDPNSSNPPEQIPLWDPSWFQKEPVGGVNPDADLEKAIGGLFNAIIELSEQNQEAKRQQMEREAERRRQQQLQEEREAAERARQAAIQEVQTSFINALTHSQFPYSAPYSNNYFFFVSVESENELSFSNVFVVPAKANQQLPYRSDIISDFKNKTGKKNSWIQGIYGSAGEAQMAQSVYRTEASKSHLSIRPMVPYNFHVGYTTSNSTVSSSPEGNDSFWGNSKDDEIASTEPSKTNMVTPKNEWANHPFYAQITKAEVPEKANLTGNYCFFLMPQTDEIVRFSNVFEVPSKPGGGLPTESELFTSISQQTQNSNLLLQGVFTDLTQAQLAKQELVVKATQTGLQLGQEVYFIYKAVNETKAPKKEDSFWGVKKQN